MKRARITAGWLVFCIGIAACGSQQATDANPGSGAGTDAATGGTGGSSGAGGTSDGGHAADGGTHAAGGGGSAVDAGPPGGPVDLPGAFNARETGGLIGASGKHVKRDVLIRSGHLGALDAAGCQRLTDLGIRTVVDLREASDAANEPDAACVSATAAYYLADLPKILPPSVQSYTQTLDAAESKLSAIYGYLGQADGMPAIVHCVIGRDRASLVTAILLLSAGVSQNDVATDFVNNQDSSISVDAAWLQPLFDRVNNAGGIEPYLITHGVTQQQIDQLRDSLLE